MGDTPTQNKKVPDSMIKREMVFDIKDDTKSIKHPS